MIKYKEDLFYSDNLYQLKNNNDVIFLCENIGYIGKLVLYNKLSQNLFERTQIQYFLNIFNSNDIKELLLDRSNYELIGVLGNNYQISEDRKYISSLTQGDSK